MYKNIERVLRALLLILLDLNRASGLSQGRYKVKGERDKALYGFSFLNITQSSMQGCMAKCLENCLCMSFQLCEGNECQLCSSDKIQQPSALYEIKGCSYFTFQRDLTAASAPHHLASCPTGINCCMTSNPCLNDGICESAFSTENITRFKCRCPNGFTGNRCQDPVKSCRGYINGTRIPGKYTIFDDELQPFDVFCDFGSDSAMAWTLVQSYKLQHKDQFLERFYEHSPAWGSYSLPKSRMISIKSDSSKWRITCRYDTDGMVYKDYICASIDKIDILTFDSVTCSQVEYINVRGQSCEQCTVRLYHENSLPFHVDGYHHGNCQFQPTESLSSNGQGEENFGLYGCQNPAHRCSANQTSTTQTWFGGN